MNNSLNSTFASERNNIMNNNNHDPLNETAFQAFLEISNKDKEAIIQNFNDYVGVFKLFTEYNPHKICEILNNLRNLITTKENLKLYISCYEGLILFQNKDIRLLGINEFFLSINYGLENIKNLLYSDDFWEYVFKLSSEIIHKLINKEYYNSLKIFIYNLTNLFGIINENNYSYLSLFLTNIKELIINNKEDIMLIGIESIYNILNNERMIKNITFLHNFILLITNIIINSLQNDILNININYFSVSSNKIQIYSLINKFMLNCKIQLEMINILDKIINNYLNIIINRDDIIIILDALEKSFNIAFSFNCNFDLRLAITYYENANNVIGLFKQMQTSIKIFYNLLVKLYILNSNKENRLFCLEYIFENSVKVLKNFIDVNKDYISSKSKIEEIEEKNINKNEINIEKKKLFEKERLINNMLEPINTYIFQNILKFEFYKYDKYKNCIIEYLLELIMSDSEDLRKIIKDILIKIYSN
jgi:hypothetical protein